MSRRRFRSIVFTAVAVLAVLAALSSVDERQPRVGARRTRGPRSRSRGQRRPASSVFRGPRTAGRSRRLALQDLDDGPGRRAGRRPAGSGVRHLGSSTEPSFRPRRARNGAGRGRKAEIDLRVRRADDALAVARAEATLRKARMNAQPPEDLFSSIEIDKAELDLELASSRSRAYSVASKHRSEPA